MKKVIHSQARIVNTLTGVYDVHIRLFRKFTFFLKIKFQFVCFLPVFIVRVPDLGTVPAPAVPAADFAGEEAHAAIPAVPLAP